MENKQAQINVVNSLESGKQAYHTPCLTNFGKVGVETLGAAGMGTFDGMGIPKVS